MNWFYSFFEKFFDDLDRWKKLEAEETQNSKKQPVRKDFSPVISHSTDAKKELPTNINNKKRKMRSWKRDFYFYTINHNFYSTTESNYSFPKSKGIGLSPNLLYYRKIKLDDDKF